MSHTVLLVFFLVWFATYCGSAFLLFHVLYDLFCHLLFIYIPHTLVYVNDSSWNEWLFYCTRSLCLKRKHPTLNSQTKQRFSENFFFHLSSGFVQFCLS
jgi:hypothetical protein